MTATRSQIDFHVVKPQHAKLHDRLVNWARWANGRAAKQTAPMFRLYQSTARVRADREVPIDVNRLDAASIAKGVAALPATHRGAINWCYLRPVNPSKASRDLGTTMAGLEQLLHDARQILINREV